MKNIEKLARTHWWTRAKVYNPKLQADLCMGAADSAAQLAGETIDAMWREVMEIETEAMRMALSQVTLAGMIKDAA